MSQIYFNQPKVYLFLITAVDVAICIPIRQSFNRATQLLRLTIFLVRVTALNFPRVISLPYFPLRKVKKTKYIFGNLLGGSTGKVYDIFTSFTLRENFFSIVSFFKS